MASRARKRRAGSRWATAATCHAQRCVPGRVLRTKPVAGWGRGVQPRHSGQPRSGSAEGVWQRRTEALRHGAGLGGSMQTKADGLHRGGRGEGGAVVVGPEGTGGGPVVACNFSVHEMLEMAAAVHEMQGHDRQINPSKWDSPEGPTSAAPPENSNPPTHTRKKFSTCNKSQYKRHLLGNMEYIRIL